MLINHPDTHKDFYNKELSIFNALERISNDDLEEAFPPGKMIASLSFASDSLKKEGPVEIVERSDLDQSGGVYEKDGLRLRSVNDVLHLNLTLTEEDIHQKLYLNLKHWSNESNPAERNWLKGKMRIWVNGQMIEEKVPDQLHTGDKARMDHFELPPELLMPGENQIEIRSNYWNPNWAYLQPSYHIHSLSFTQEIEEPQHTLDKRNLAEGTKAVISFRDYPFTKGGSVKIRDEGGVHHANALMLTGGQETLSLSLLFTEKEIEKDLYLDLQHWTLERPHHYRNPLGFVSIWLNDQLMVDGFWPETRLADTAVDPDSVRIDPFKLPSHLLKPGENKLDIRPTTSHVITTTAPVYFIHSLAVRHLFF